MVLDNLRMKVPDGAIYGFLGPNGAGKTTTLKLALGLLQPQQGSIALLGQATNAVRRQVLRQVGSLIEMPSLYGHLTARENLALMQVVYQCPKARIDDVLTLVGLGAVGKKKAGNFSLGMKQRLGIAMALLHRPNLLILDEPTNGLDPNGIIEMRELLRYLNKEEQMTILVSSHLLSEIEKVATHLGIINGGRMLFEGTIDDLRSRQQKAGITMQTSNNAAARQLITAAGIAATLAGDSIMLAATGKEALGELTRQLALQGISVYEMATAHTDLETIFLDLLKTK